MSVRIIVRLIRIDTPEIRTRDEDEKKRCFASRDWLREQILGKKVLLHTSERGKFGRWLGTIWNLEENKPLFENDVNLYGKDYKNGLHPNSLGYDIIAKTLKDFIDVVHSK